MKGTTPTLSGFHRPSETALFGRAEAHQPSWLGFAYPLRKSGPGHHSAHVHEQSSLSLAKITIIISIIIIIIIIIITIIMIIIIIISREPTERCIIVMQRINTLIEHPPQKQATQARQWSNEDGNQGYTCFSVKIFTPSSSSRETLILLTIFPSF